MIILIQETCIFLPNTRTKFLEPDISDVAEKMNQGRNQSNQQVILLNGQTVKTKSPLGYAPQRI